MPDLPLIRTIHAALPETMLPPDTDLLSRYATTRDAAAFELLVRRHAGLVWAACAGILGRDRATAEDAFQSTFLTLARKAGAVRGNLPGWLFRVARRRAVRAARRPRATGPSIELDSLPAVARPPSDGEAAAVVLEEVERLAARLREPVLLCFYQGHTHAEAAAKLGWPLGTVASRLARAKDRLRDRLTRRGVTLAAVAAAGIDNALVHSAVATALGPPAAVPPAVASLTSGVVFAMRIAKLKLAAAVTVFVGIAAVGVAVGVGQESEKPKPAASAPNAKADNADRPPAGRPRETTNDSPLRKLQIARFNLALAEHEAFGKQGLETFNATGWEKVTTLTAAAVDVFPPAEATAWHAWRVAVGKRNEDLMNKLKAMGGAHADPIGQPPACRGRDRSAQMDATPVRRGGRP